MLIQAISKGVSMDTSSDKKSYILPIIIALLVAVAVIIYFVVNNNSNDSTTEVDRNAATSEQVEGEQSQLAKIAEAPSDFAGTSVTVQGEIQDVLSQRAFKVADQVSGDELLVIFPEALPEDRAQEAEKFLVDNANAQVTGVVRIATFAEYERDYGLLFDEPGVEAEFESKPVLVATDVKFTDESGTDFDFTFDFDVDATLDADAS